MEVRCRGDRGPSETPPHRLIVGKAENRKGKMQMPNILVYPRFQQGSTYYYRLSLKELPSFPYAERSRLPRCQAVYFIVDTHRYIHYIGATQDLHNRLISHGKRSAVLALDSPRIYWIVCDDMRDAEDIERACINHFNPPMNMASRPLLPAPKSITRAIALAQEEGRARPMWQQWPLIYWTPRF
jgi:hypothetical protein